MYYSDRHGIERPKLTLNLIRRRIYGLYVIFERRGYFQGAFGYNCVDNGIVYGDKAMTLNDYMEIEIDIHLDLSNINDVASLSEEILFNFIEFMYNTISKPIQSSYHSFGDCGLHVSESDYESGREEFKNEVNKILPFYEKQLFLNNSGKIEEIDVELRRTISTSTRGKVSSEFFTFTPTVFKKPEEDPDLGLVSVMMPFSMNFNNVYETMKESCLENGLDCKRADDIWEDSILIQDIFKLIYSSSIVICDFTGKNPNVLYEAGIAHTLGKIVIPITQNIEHIPFDLRPHRCKVYLDNGEGRIQLKEELKNRLKYLKENYLSRI